MSYKRSLFWLRYRGRHRWTVIFKAEEWERVREMARVAGVGPSHWLKGLINSKWIVHEDDSVVDGKIEE